MSPSSFCSYVSATFAIESISIANCFLNRKEKLKHIFTLKKSIEKTQDESTRNKQIPTIVPSIEDFEVDKQVEIVGFFNE